MNTYKVIELINEYSILVNYGIINGARAGDTLRIFSTGEPVLDPVDKSLLGTLDIIKETVEVITPYEQFSLCQKVNRHQVSIINPLSNLVQTKKTISKLNVKNSDLSRDILRISNESAISS